MSPLCSLFTPIEGILFGAVLLFSLFILYLNGRLKKASAQARGLAPQDKHPEDRYRERRQKEQHQQSVEDAARQFNDAYPPHLDWLRDTEPIPPAGPLPPQFGDPIATAPEPEQPAPADYRSLLQTYLPHLKPPLFALSVVLVWFGFASWYDNLSQYEPPTPNSLGDFRILYLKKFVGALLPLISGVGASLGLLFMISPRYYIYLNAWYPTDYDFYADLRNLHQPDAFRRVLVFCLLFGLLLLCSLFVLLHSSPQELTQ